MLNKDDLLASWDMVFTVQAMCYCRTCKIHYIKYSRIWSPRHFHYMYFSCGENLHIQGIMPVLFAWRLREWLRSYDAIKFSQLKAHLFIQDKIQTTCILWDVITRGVINSVCSPLAIYILKLYRIDEDRETYFSQQPLKLSTFLALQEWGETSPSIATTCGFCEFVLPRKKR